ARVEPRRLRTAPALLEDAALRLGQRQRPRRHEHRRQPLLTYARARQPRLVLCPPRELVLHAKRPGEALPLRARRPRQPPRRHEQTPPRLLVQRRDLLRILDQGLQDTNTLLDGVARRLHATHTPAVVPEAPPAARGHPAGSPRRPTPQPSTCGAAS